MFVCHSFTGDCAVVPLLLLGQILFFAALDWMLSVCVNFLDSLVACVKFELDAAQRTNA